MARKKDAHPVFSCHNNSFKIRQRYISHLSCTQFIGCTYPLLPHKIMQQSAVCYHKAFTLTRHNHLPSFVFVIHHDDVIKWKHSLRITDHLCEELEIDCSPSIKAHSWHHSDVIMGAMASQITSFTIVYSTVDSGADQRNIKAVMTGVRFDRGPEVNLQKDFYKMFRKILKSRCAVRFHKVSLAIFFL